MGVWILTIILAGSNGGAAVTTQEFTSQIACQAALVDIREKYKDSWSPPHIIMVCTQK